MTYAVIDSGERRTYAGGMLKEVTDKPRYTLIDRPFLRRLAEHMTKGARKYGPDNWRLGSSQDELDGFKDSAWRHLMAWIDGETDEDHGAAVVANIMMAEGIKGNITPAPNTLSELEAEMQRINQARKEALRDR